MTAGSGGSLDVDSIDVLLCDADGTLFDSEGPAFVASTEVLNSLLARLGIDLAPTPDELRRVAAGRNFRSTASALAAEAGVDVAVDVLEQWVDAERVAVTDALMAVLRPTSSVRHVLDVLSRQVRLSVVSSSATARLRACLRATRLDDLFPSGAVVSAEDSLPTPASKPDPAVYRFAAARMGVHARRALAVEDAVSGVASAVAADIPTVGMLQFVPQSEHAERSAALRDAGAAAVLPSWRQLGRMLASGTRRGAPPG